MTDERPARVGLSRASAETLAEARRLYETTDLKQVEIATRLGLHGSSISRMASRDGWLRPAAAERRRETVRSIRRKVEAEMAKAEAVIATDGAPSGGEAAKAARNLASLVRSLRELEKYDEERRGAARRGEADDRAGDDAADIDAFRATLAERLERLHRERNG